MNEQITEQFRSNPRQIKVFLKNFQIREILLRKLLNPREISENCSEIARSSRTENEAGASLSNTQSAGMSLLLRLAPSV